MERINLVTTGLAGTFLVASAFAAPINYREHWDVYATGEADPTYNAVWTPDAAVQNEYVAIGTANPTSSPNALVIDPRNRAIDNSLVDGIDNTGVGGQGIEMSPGQYVVPGGALGDPENLQLGYYMIHGNGPQRQHISTYAEISFGDVHAPWGANALDALANPIPVFALGKLNANFTSSGGATAQNVGIYFFNGVQWVRSALGTAAGSNRMWADMFYNSVDAKWQVRLREAVSGGTAGPYDLAFDPSALGFNAISWREINAGRNWTGGVAGDDVLLTGGDVLPEPASLLILGVGGLLATRRRRS